MLARLTFSLMGGKEKEAKAENAERLKCNRDHRFALQGPFSHNQPTPEATAGAEGSEIPVTTATVAACDRIGSWLGILENL